MSTMEIIAALIGVAIFATLGIGFWKLTSHE
jgi:hypothetical protein